MFSKNLQFRNLLYKAVSVAVTGEVCILLPHTKNSAAVSITFSIGVYYFYIIMSSVSLITYFNPQISRSFKDRPC